MSDLTFYIAATQKFNIYCGSVIFVAGVIGGLSNLVVSLSLQTFRESSCAFYLTIMSVVNIGQLFTVLFTRIMISGFNIDWTPSSLFYCKFRAFSLQFCISTSFSCFCLATVDQFLATCSSRYWQHYSHIRVARCLTIVVIIVWILHGIPYLMFNQHIVANGVQCVIGNETLQKYSSYIYGILIAGVCPVGITTVFGLLAFRNVRQIAHRTVPLVRRELDKQLTVMILVQGFFNVWSLLPYIVTNSLPLNPSFIGDPFLFPRWYFANSLTLLIYYLYFAMPFYIYMCVSERFRQQLIHVLCRSGFLLYRTGAAHNNQVEPQT